MGAESSDGRACEPVGDADPSSRPRAGSSRVRRSPAPDGTRAAPVPRHPVRGAAGRRACAGGRPSRHPPWTGVRPGGRVRAGRAAGRSRSQSPLPGFLADASRRSTRTASRSTCGRPSGRPAAAARSSSGSTVARSSPAARRRPSTTRRGSPPRATPSSSRSTTGSARSASWRSAATARGDELRPPRPVRGARVGARERGGVRWRPRPRHGVRRVGRRGVDPAAAGVPAARRRVPAGDHPELRAQGPRRPTQAGLVTRAFLEHLGPGPRRPRPAPRRCRSTRPRRAGAPRSSRRWSRPT